MTHFRKTFGVTFAFYFLVSGLVAVWSSQLDAQAVAPKRKSPAISAVESRISELEARRDRFDNEVVGLFQQVQSSLTSKLVDLNKELEAFGAPESIPTTVNLLAKQRVELSIDLAGLDRRREILVEQIAVFNEDKDWEVEKSFMQSLLKLEEDAHSIVKQQVDAGTVHISELQDAKRRVILAQLRISESGRTARQSNVPKQELKAISLEIAEKKARLSRVVEELKTLAPAGRKLEEKELVKLWLNNAQQSMTRYEIQNADLDRELRSYQTQLEQLRIDELADDN